MGRGPYALLTCRLFLQQKKCLNLMSNFPVEVLKVHHERLNNHSIYGAVKTIDDLKVFMEHHAFSVWDFMSLIKSLQAILAPTRVPWAPVGDPMVRRFINELVLEEETDQVVPETRITQDFISHYELYTYAMEEIGASPVAIKTFVATAYNEGIEAAFNQKIAPDPSAAFTRKTFDFINSGKPHVMAAALALGREHIIPDMFRSLLRQMRLDERLAPAFHYYLKRHIHLDEDFHGPLSLRMVEFFIQDDETKRREAIDAAISAIDVRIQFWDGVLSALPSNVAATVR